MTKGEKIAESNRRRRGEKRNFSFTVEFTCLNCKQVFVGKSTKRMYCTPACEKEYRKEEIKTYFAEYHLRYQEKKNTRSKKYRDDNPGKSVDKARIKKYGLTPEQYALMFKEQGGVCAICGRPERTILRGKPRSLSVDHCHSSGRIRGLLCGLCNLGLGGFEDNIEYLLDAIVYLERSRE